MKAVIVGIAMAVLFTKNGQGVLMDNKNDIERNRQLRRIADALERIAKNTQKSIDNVTVTSNGITLQYEQEEK